MSCHMSKECKAESNQIRYILIREAAWERPVTLLSSGHCGQVRDNIAILRDFSTLSATKFAGARLRDFLRDNHKGSATMAQLDFIGF